MLLVTGIVQRITERQAGNPGSTWTEQTIVVADFGVTHYCTVAREFGPLPQEGEPVALSVSVRPYMKRDGSGAGFGLTAFGRDEKVEANLYGLTSAGASAV